ncbi:glycosyl hydrolases family 18-domain-containing protein [Flagelloscypha sp. PMI_526]|nr:glycosyl hydrolases family 18-domain-containing protein [Flagelloscypha sp. PMI_526]
MVALKTLFVLLSALLVADATQVMHRPDNYKVAPKKFAMEAHPKIHTITRRAASGYVSVGYFPNWAIYAGHNYFFPQYIVPTQLTHILYSFADVSPDTGAISLTDLFADEQKHFDGDSWDEPGNNLYGCLKQVYLLKLKNRNLKVLLSVGGWTYSQSGHFNFVTDSTKRAKFVSDSVQFIKDYGFDGIDIDFEYPSSTALGSGFASLVTELRTAFNSLASSNGDSVPYQITAAVSAGDANNAYLNVPTMNAALSYWNVMAYDFAGSWLTFADNQANLYGGARTNVSGDRAVQHYKSAGATASKITFGMPLYGRTFSNTNGIGQAYSGTSGDIDTGVYAYKSLPLAGSQVYENTTDVSSYSYDSSKKELVSYDTPSIIKTKSQYIKDQGLAGSMFWELSIDKSGADSLIEVSKGVLGTLDTTQNHIKYPNSKWTNIQNNMGQGGGGTTTTTTTTPPTGGQCSGVAAYSSTSIYTGGMTTVYNSHLWQAKWWTQGEAPSTGGSGVWTDLGAC